MFAGASKRDITPLQSMFLYGYPHTPRISTGVSDPLWATALYLCAGQNKALFVSVDLLMLSHHTVRECRRAISSSTGVPTGSILIGATHTHSAPVTCELIAFRGTIRLCRR